MIDLAHTVFIINYLLACAIIAITNIWKNMHVKEAII
jgi:hypothetical protein